MMSTAIGDPSLHKRSQVNSRVVGHPFMQIDRIDHFVLTVRDILATCDFYERALGMEREVFGEGRIALTFGSQKINLHEAGNELEPCAEHPTPGGGDFCLITTTPIDDVVRHLKNVGVEIELMPSPRTGATGPITSVYFRDPDQNLVEISTYD
jgi:catechol 2,3-dioxygenase-like lactoylglutathione lyase family enzyme